METTVDPKIITKRLRRDTWNAITEYNMLEDGDKIMVCLSGGKDSYTLLDMLMHYQKASDIQFEIVAVNMDQKQPGFPVEVLPNYLESVGVEYLIVEQETNRFVKKKIPEGKPPAVYALVYEEEGFTLPLKRLEPTNWL